MCKTKKYSCTFSNSSKCLSCQRKSTTSNMSDFKLCDNDLDLIVGGMNPDDLKKVMQLAATDMNLEALTPTSYFQ